MTDKEIGAMVREIADRGFKAEVYRNKDGIVIMEVKKSIVKADKNKKNAPWQPNID